MNPNYLDLAHSSPWALWFVGWLLLNLLPFTAAGAVLLVASSAGWLSPRFLKWVTCLVLAVTVFDAYLSAAAVYDQCNDPAYVNTIWWWVWGCYAR